MNLKGNYFGSLLFLLYICIMEVIKNSFKAKITLPKPDLTGWDYNEVDITISTEFRPEYNTFKFKCRIPKFVYDGVADSDTKYLTNPPKPEYSHERKANKFTQSLVSDNLTLLLANLSEVCSDAIQVKTRETAKTEKYIAITFNQSNLQKKGSFNHADMGKLTKSSFQFFPLYKAIKPKNSLDRYNYKSDKVITSNNSNLKPDGWYWYAVGEIERNFQLIKWTQEREDFLQSIQDKFVSMNERLETFLGDIDDNKIIELMSNSQFLLNNTN